VCVDKDWSADSDEGELDAQLAQLFGILTGHYSRLYESCGLVTVNTRVRHCSLSRMSPIPFQFSWPLCQPPCGHTDWGTPVVGWPWLQTAPLFGHRESAPKFISILREFARLSGAKNACRYKVHSSPVTASGKQAVWSSALPWPQCDPWCSSNCCSPVHSSVGKGHWSSLRPILRSWCAWLGTWLCYSQWRAANCTCDSPVCENYLSFVMFEDRYYVDKRMWMSAIKRHEMWWGTGCQRLSPAP